MSKFQNNIDLIDEAIASSLTIFIRSAANYWTCYEIARDTDDRFVLYHYGYTGSGNGRQRLKSYLDYSEIESCHISLEVPETDQVLSSKG